MIPVFPAGPPLESKLDRFNKSIEQDQNERSVHNVLAINHSIVFITSSPWAANSQLFACFDVITNEAYVSAAQ